jgi:hypothetical protein
MCVDQLRAQCLYVMYIYMLLRIGRGGVWTLHGLVDDETGLLQV